MERKIIGSVDRLEENIAVIVLDNGNIIHLQNEQYLKEGDMVSFFKGNIEKIDNSIQKKRIFDLQKKILEKDN